jgi:hypothetical protein
MPFEQVIPLSLTVNAVRSLAPALSGVYGVSNGREWIYIGETDNIRATLLDHIGQANSEVMCRKPTGFVFEACVKDRRMTRQDRLILEYEPVCNRRRASAR